MKFEWNTRKAQLNFAKHNVTFEEATTVFRDPLSLTSLDPDHSLDEMRFVTFGLSFAGKVLQVSHAERGESIRIISARAATKNEIKIYEEG